MWGVKFEMQILKNSFFSKLKIEVRNLKLLILNLRFQISNAKSEIWNWKCEIQERKLWNSKLESTSPFQILKISQNLWKSMKNIKNRWKWHLNGTSFSGFVCIFGDFQRSPPSLPPPLPLLPSLSPSLPHSPFPPFSPPFLPPALPFSEMFRDFQRFPEIFRDFQRISEICRDDIPENLWKSRNIPENPLKTSKNLCKWIKGKHNPPSLNNEGYI